MLKSYSCYYDSTTNVAEVIDTDSPDQREDDCQYELTERGEFYELDNYDGERLILKQSKQTKEQAVILFAVMLGQREAAREEE